MPGHLHVHVRMNTVLLRRIRTRSDTEPFNAERVRDRYSYA